VSPPYSGLHNLEVNIEFGNSLGLCNPKYIKNGISDYIIQKFGFESSFWIIKYEHTFEKKLPNYIIRKLISY